MIKCDSAVVDVGSKSQINSQWEMREGQEKDIGWVRVEML